MQSTPHWGLPYPSGSDVPDVPAHLEALAVALDDVAKYAQGPVSARPVSSIASPGKRGRLYFATDEGVLYLDTGTAWQAVQPQLVTDGPANVGTLRTLGTGAQQAAAGNDPRLSDARVPLDGSVTAAKVASSLKPSEGAGNSVEALRAIGSGPGQVVAGNDVRLSGRRSERAFGLIAVTTGVIPGWSHSEEEWETCSLVKVRYGLATGTATVQLRVNGTVLMTFNLTTSRQSFTASPFPYVLAEDDYIDLNVTAANNATGLSFTVATKRA